MTNPIYESQTRPSAMPLELRRGPAPGAIVGDAVADFGQTMLRAELVDRQRERASAAADRSVAFAQMQADIDGELQQLKLDTPADGSGYEEKANAIVERRTSAFVDTLADPQIRNAFLPDVARLRANSLTSASAYAIERRGTKLVTDEETATATLANNLGRAPSDANWELYQQLTDKRLAQYGGMLPAAAIDELRRKSLATGAVAFVKGLPPEQGKAALDSGRFDSLLPAEKMLALKNSVEVDLNQLAAERRAADRAAKADERENLGDLRQQFAQAGIGNPADAEAAAQRAAAIGDKTGARWFRDKGVRWTVAASLKGASPVALEQHIAGLMAERARAGVDVPHDLDVKIAAAQDVLSQTRSLIQQSPTMWRAWATGQQPPAFDWDNPAPYVRYAQAAAREAGVKAEVLPDEVATVLRDQMSGGTAGRIEVARQLARLPDPRARIDAARQVAPNDPGFRQALGLGPIARRDALRGVDAIKAHPKIFKDADIDTVFAGEFGRAVQLLSVEQQQGIKEAARAIAAARMVDAQLVEPDKKSAQDYFRVGVQAASGRTGNGDQMAGGVYSYGRGYGADFAVVLPGGVRGADFERTIARASGAALAKAGGGKPVFDNGVEIPAARIKTFRPVLDGATGGYKFWTGEGWVKRADGRDFVLNYRLLAQ